MADKPNVLLIMSDQHNPQVMGCAGHQDDQQEKDQRNSHECQQQLADARHADDKGNCKTHYQQCYQTQDAICYHRCDYLCRPCAVAFGNQLTLRCVTAQG